MLCSSQGVTVDCAELSHPGRDPDKQVNEDASALSPMPFGILAVVCDGMGGHAGGELASRAAVSRIREVLQSSSEPLDRLLPEAVRQAHLEVERLGGSAPPDARPGSTAVLLALSAHECFVAHVGDSRAYRVRQDAIERLTRDHSVVQALLAAGAITEEQAKVHPEANRITRALGIGPENQPELQPPMQVAPGDTFVTCTDGLTDLVEDAEIAELCRSAASPEAACQALVDLANQRGGHDNITVQVLRVSTDPARARHGTVMPIETTVVEQPTVVEEPSFTVVMGDPPGPAPTVELEGEPTRLTEPAIVDAVGPPTLRAGQAPGPVEPEAALELRERSGRTLFLVMAVVSALIFLSIALWSVWR